MPCLLGCLALFTPRLVLVLVFLFSDFLGQAYKTVLWPVLGFLFMPLTTLAYAGAMHWNGQVTGMYFAMVLAAALMDLGVLGGSGVSSRRSRWLVMKRKQ